MTKAAITKEAEEFIELVRSDSLLAGKAIRFTYESSDMPGSGRATGTQIILRAIKDEWPAAQVFHIIPLPRIRKAGEWLGFLHDEINRLMATPMKIKSGTTTPKKR